MVGWKGLPKEDGKGTENVVGGNWDRGTEG